MARPLFARSSSRSEPLHRPAPGPAGTALKAAVWRYSSPLPVLTGLQAVLKNMSLLSVFKVRFTLPAPSLLPACAHPSGRVGALTYPCSPPKFPRLRLYMPQPSPRRAHCPCTARISALGRIHGRTVWGGCTGGGLACGSLAIHTNHAIPHKSVVHLCLRRSRLH